MHFLIKSAESHEQSGFGVTACLFGAGHVRGQCGGNCSRCRRRRCRQNHDDAIIGLSPRCVLQTSPGKRHAWYWVGEVNEEEDDIDEEYAEQHDEDGAGKSNDEEKDKVMKMI